MRFTEYLEERRLAGVHVKGPLSVITDLVQREFGLNFTRIYGGCLVTQFIYTLSTIANIPPQHFATFLDDEYVGSSGTTFEWLFDRFDNTDVQLGKRVYRFNLDLEKPSIKEAIELVRTGQPVVAIISASIANDIDEYSNIVDGILDSDKATHPRNTLAKSGDQYHALLLIGYDSQDQMLIFRESRHRYALKGYIKIREKDLSNENIHFVATIVDDFTKK